MSIFLNKDSKVIVQGITGGEGTKHTALMLKAGTQLVGGVNARKAGTTVSHVDKDGKDIELPVFGSVAEAMKETGADVSVVFVPPKFAKDAIIEAIDAEIPLLVVITEGIPVQDSAYAWAYNVEQGQKTRIIGPNCPGVITPGEALAGITPANITGSGPVGLVSKSGTLTYQMMFELRDLGFSTAIGIGGDPVIGTTHIDAIEAFEKDPDTKVIVMIGEIGGDAEERAADYIKANVSKPVVGYVAGFTAPEGKTMGHAGAIVSGSSGTAAAKEGRPGSRGGQGRQDAVGDREAGPRDSAGPVGPWLTIESVTDRKSADSTISPQSRLEFKFRRSVNGIDPPHPSSSALASSPRTSTIPATAACRGLNWRPRPPRPRWPTPPPMPTRSPRRSTWSSVCGSSRSRRVCPLRSVSRTTIRGR